MKRIDFSKIFFHPHILASCLAGESFFPFHMTIGLTNRCNHKCLWCYAEYQKVKQATIDAEVLIKNLAQMSKRGLEAVTIVGGGNRPSILISWIS